MNAIQREAYERAVDFLCLADVPCEGMFHVESGGQVEISVLTTPEAMLRLGGFTVKTSDTHGPGFLDVTSHADAWGLRFQCTVTDEAWSELTETVAAAESGRPAVIGSGSRAAAERSSGEGNGDKAGPVPLGGQ